MSAGADNFSAIQNAQSGLAAQTADCSVGVGFCIPRLKPGYNASQLFNLVSKLRRGGSLPPLSKLVQGTNTVSLSLLSLALHRAFRKVIFNQHTNITHDISIIRRILSSVRLTQYDMLPQHQVNIRTVE